MTVDFTERLKEQGWYISEHGYRIATDSGNIVDLHRIVKRLLDLDLRETGSGEGDIQQGNIVLQIQKLRNVAAPKNNEESRSAPRMLKLSLTDGKNNYQAVEVEHISSLSLNTPPGTKILIKGGNLSVLHGLFLLRPSHIGQVLGGKVTNLVEKWELNKKLAFHTRVRPAEEGGPPPWIPFGKKIIKVTEQDKNFKALADKEKANNENTEFEAQRKDAIAEAAKQGTRKVFGGGNKQLLDHSVQKIVDQGFTIEQAEYALKVNRNNVDKALRSLQKTDSRHNTFKESREPRTKRFEKKAEESKPSSGKISLFDFLEDKLPIQTETAETNNLPSNSHTQTTESNHNKIETKGNDSQIGKNARPQKGNRGYQAPPRHSDDSKSNNKRPGNNSGSVPNQYSQYNGGNSSQQNKPPRFQRNQESQNYYQDGGGKTYQKSQPNEHRNSYQQQQSRAEAVSESGNSCYKPQQEQQGKSLGGGRNYNHLEADARHSRQPYDAFYGRHNRAQQQQQQDGPHRACPASTNDKNYKNQLNRYQPNDSSRGPERADNHYGNNQNSNVSVASTNYVWRVGDKCLAKYWEDSRYYSAEVTSVSNRTCVVQFKGFGNYEEVLQIDCIPITEEQPPVVQESGVDSRRSEQRFGNRQPRYDQSYNHISAGMEFRRGGGGGSVATANKNYAKKRNPQRTSQPIYQPPAQRTQNSINVQENVNPLL